MSYFKTWQFWKDFHSLVLALLPVVQNQFYRCLYKGRSHPPLMFVGVLCCSCLTLVSFHLWTCLFPITSVGYGEGDRFHLAPFCVKFLNKNTLRIYNPLSFSLSKLKKPHWSILRAWWRPKGRNHSSLTSPCIAPPGRFTLSEPSTSDVRYVRRNRCHNGTLYVTLVRHMFYVPIPRSKPMFQGNWTTQLKISWAWVVAQCTTTQEELPSVTCLVFYWIW